MDTATYRPSLLDRKLQLFSWLVYDLAKQDPSSRLSWWALVLHWLLMPWWSARQTALGAFWDCASNVYTIEGVKFSGEFFRQFASGLRPGSYFRLISRSLVNGERVISVGELRRVFVVGQYRMGDFPNIAWELQGVFYSEEDAVAACRTDQYFVVEIESGVNAPHEPVHPVKSWYPLRATP